MKTKSYILTTVIVLLLLFIACYLSYQTGKKAAERDRQTETEKIIGGVPDK